MKLGTRFFFFAGILIFGFSSSQLLSQTSPTEGDEWVSRAREIVEEVRQSAPSHAARLSFLVSTYERESEPSLIREHIVELFDRSVRKLENFEAFQTWRRSLELEALTSLRQNLERDRVSRARAFYISSFELLSDNEDFLRSLQPADIANILSDLSRLKDFTWTPSHRSPSFETVREIEMTDVLAMESLSEFVYAWFSVRHSELSGDDLITAIDFQTGNIPVFSSGKYELFHEFWDFVSRGRFYGPERIRFRFIEQGRDFDELEQARVDKLFVMSRWAHLKLRQPRLSKAMQRAFGKIEGAELRAGGVFIVEALVTLGQPWATRPEDLVRDFDDLLRLTEMSFRGLDLDFEKVNSLLLLRMANLLENALDLSFSASQREKILQLVLRLSTQIEERRKEAENASRELVFRPARESDWRAFGQSLVRVLEKWVRSGSSDAETKLIRKLGDGLQLVQYRGRFFRRVKLVDRIEEALRSKSTDCRQAVSEAATKARLSSSHLPPY